MKHESAVELWNNTCQTFHEQCAEMTLLGAAATVKDVPVWTAKTSEYVMREKKGYAFDKNTIIAAFLREWADALERVSADEKA
jgi:hypothetical protein